MPGRHQIPAAVLAGPHQIPRRFLLHTRDRHRDDLAQVQQPGQMPGIAGIGLDPIPAGRCNFDGAATRQSMPCAGQEPGQPEPGRAGLIGDRHRTAAATRSNRGSRGDPGSTGARTPPGLPVQPARDHRTCVHIQPDTRTHDCSLGPPTSCGSTGRTRSCPATHDHMWRGPSQRSSSGRVVRQRGQACPCPHRRLSGAVEAPGSRAAAGRRAAVASATLEAGGAAPYPARCDQRTTSAMAAQPPPSLTGRMPGLGASSSTTGLSITPIPSMPPGRVGGATPTPNCSTGPRGRRSRPRYWPTWIYRRTPTSCSHATPRPSTTPTERWPGGWTPTPR